MPKWTTAQENAINARDCNIVVSAAAGSGKTAVLVERVVSLITDVNKDVDIDKLLIVTFTNAAAAEMRCRISNRLNELLSASPNDSNLIRQLSLLPNAQICTIDSFCINLVRENFFKLNIDQDFTIMEESQRSLVENEIIESLIDKMYESEDEGFTALVKMLSSSKSDSRLASTVRKLDNYIMSQAFPFEWLDSLQEFYNPCIPLDNTIFKSFVFEEISDMIELSNDLIALSRSSLNADDELFEKYNEMLDKDSSVFKMLSVKVSGGNWDELREIIDDVSFSTMPSKRGYNSPSKELLNSNRKTYKDIATKKISGLVTLSSAEYEEDCSTLYPIIKALISIVKDFHKRVEDEKRDLNSYTFGDIEHFAIELLYHKENGKVVKTSLAKEYESNFYEILVDEYQDTNYAQDTLFEMLSNGRNRFVVGDVKQSIYKFRLAMPYIFNDRKNKSELYDALSDAVDKRIILDKNFRSRKGICEYTNFVFSHIMSTKVGEMEYTDEEYLNYGANYEPNDTPCAQLCLVDVPDGENADEYEAHQVAKYIRNKVDNKELIQDGGVLREVRYGDFAILFRAPKNRMPIYTKVFSEYGIPSVSNNKVNLFENNEVSILLSLIRVVDNPIQDVPLLSTLMSPFYGYTPDDIALARVNNKAKNLYSSIRLEGDRFKKILEDLKRYREYAASMSVESFLMHIISDTSYLSIVSAMGNAEQRRLNVLKFVDIAKRFDRGEYVGLTAFVRYVDAIIANDLNIDSANASGVGNDSVELMSIHNSKGLEFPICILAGSAHKYNTEDQKQQVQINQQYGLGLKVHNDELMYRYDSLQLSVIRSVNNYTAMSENLRVLYVAITRAKEQFVTFYSRKDLPNAINSLSSKIIDGAINPIIAKSIERDGDFLVLCALLHKDGKALRDLCDNDIKTDIYADFEMSVSFLNGIEEADNLDEATVSANEEIVSKIADKLEFSYDRLELKGIASKRTASSLDDKNHSFEYFASSKPAFLNSSGMTPAQKGTAMHNFMQYCDYNNAKSCMDEEIDRLIEKNFITKDQADSLDKNRLSKFFNSTFASRMFNSDNIHREIKVSSFVKVSELEDTCFEDDVLVQGIADCVFEENGELVLVDYKTDRVDSEEELLDRYKNQLSFYKMAISKTLGMPVKEVVLYSFYLNKVCIYK